ncbi:MAG: hypothetical protein ABFE08_08125, partial [Armatimonadia bacterium]
MFGELKQYIASAGDPGSVYCRRVHGGDMVWMPSFTGDEWIRLAGNYNTMHVDWRDGHWEECTASGRLLAYDQYAQVSIPDPYDPLLAARCNYGHITSSRDPNGNETYFTYDAAHRLDRVYDAAGRAIYFGYGADGYLDTMTDWAGRTHYYEHDSYGHLVKQTGPEGCMTSYEYSSDYRMTSMTDPDGYTTYYDYEWGPLPYNGPQSSVPEGWKVSKIISCTGGTTYYRYDKVIGFDQSWGGATTVVDVLGNPTYYNYNIHHHLLSTKTGSGVEQQQGWDGYNRHVNDLDPLGNLTWYTTDYYGNRTSVQDALGNVTYYNYNVTNPKANRLREVIDPLLHTTRYDYDDRANLIKETDALDHASYYAYDQHGQMISGTDKLGATTYYDYDAYGNMVWVRDALGQATYFSHDLAGNVVSSLDPLGNASYFEYDKRDKVVKT